MDPEKLKEVWRNAHRLRQEFRWARVRVNIYIREQTGLKDLAALTAAAFPAIPEPPDAPPGAFATGAEKFGRGASLGFSDELAGAVDAVGAMAPGGESPGDAYSRGRKENLDYDKAAGEAHPDISAVAQTTGAALTGALLPIGRVAAGGSGLLPTLARGAAAGAGFGALNAVGYAPEQPDPMAYLGKSVKGGAMAGGLLSGAMRGAQTTANPAASRLEEMTAMESGNPSALAAVTGKAEAQGEETILNTLRQLQATGVKNPMLFDGGEALRAEALRFVPRANPVARRMAIGKIQTALDEASAAKQLAEKGYDQLDDIAVANPAALNLLRRNGQLPKGGVVRFRQLKDLQIRLKSKVSAGYKQWQNGNNSNLAATRELDADADELTQILVNEVPGYSTLQAEVAPLIEREKYLRNALISLNRGRGRMMPSPGAGAPGHALKEVVSGSTFGRNARAARELVDLLFTPGDPAELLRRAHALRPNFFMPGGLDVVGGATGALLPRDQKEE